MGNLYLLPFTLRQRNNDSVGNRELSEKRIRRHNRVVFFDEKSSNSTGTSFPVTSSRTCWRRRQSPDHLDMSRWSESRQLPRNFLVTSWRLPRNICYGEVTGKLVPVEFELMEGLHTCTYYV